MAEIIGNEESMLDRAFMMLEDEEFEDANAMLENVLNMNSRNAQAYIGKLMIDLKVATVEDLSKVEVSFADNKNYKRAIKFAADDKQRAEFESYSKKEVKAEAKPEQKKPEEPKKDAKPVFNTTAKEAPAFDEHAAMDEGKALLTQGKYDLASKKFSEVISNNEKNAEAYMCRLCATLKVPEIGALVTVKNSFADNADYKKALQFVTDPMDKIQYQSFSQSFDALAQANKKAKEEAEAKVRAEAKAREEEAKKKAEDAKKKAEEDKKAAEEAKKKAAEEYANLAKVAKEKAEKEAAEKAAKEKAEKEAAEKAAKEAAAKEAEAKKKAEEDKKTAEEAKKKAAEEYEKLTKAAKEKAEKEAAEKAAKEKAAKEAAAKEAKELAEKAAKEKAAKEAAEKEAAEKAAKEKAAKEAAEKEAKAKAEKEAAEKAAKEKAAKEAAEKEAKAKAEKEAAEKAAKEKAAKEAAEKEAKAKAEKEAAEKAAKEKAAKEAAEKEAKAKAEKEKAEKEAASAVKVEKKEEKQEKKEEKKAEKEAAKQAKPEVKDKALENAGFNIKPEELIKSAFLMIENLEFDQAEGLLDKALGMEPKNPKAYIGKLLCDLKVSREANLLMRSSAFDDDENYKKAVEYAEGEEKQKYIDYSDAVKKNILKVKKRTKRLAAMPIVNKAFDTDISIAVNLKSKEAVIISNKERTQVDATAFGEMQKWDDIIAVAAAEEHIVGLRTDGGAYAAGINDDNRCNVVNWKDVTEIFVGKDISVGLKTDGTVFAVGNNIVDMWDALSWKNIKNVSVGDGFIISTDTNGDVHAVGSNTFGQCSVDMWERMTQVAAGSRHALGLCADGTVLATGDNNKGQCKVDDWKDIVMITADGNASFGLKIDGTIVAEGFEGKAYKSWKDVCAIKAQNGYLIAAKTDGTVVSEPADLKFNKLQMNIYKDTAADIQVKILETAKELTQKEFNPFAAKLLKTVVSPDDKALYAMCENKEIPIDEIIYVKAGQLKDEGLSDAAKAAYKMLGDYKDAAQLMLVCNVGVIEKAYKEAIECIKSGDYYTANYLLEKHAEYTDSTPELEEIKAQYVIAAYNKGSEAMDRQTFKIARSIIGTTDIVELKVEDAKIKEKIEESKFAFKAVAYEKASKAMEDEMYYDNAKELLLMIGDFKNSKELLEKCEKGLKDRAVKEKALNEAIEKAKQEAEKKARETGIKEEIDRLNEELSNLSGWFIGKKKAQIEEQIKALETALENLD